MSSSRVTKIQEQWRAIKAAIEAGVTLASYFVLDRDTITSANALAPVVYYLSRIGNELAGAWSDLDWDELADALDRIRHESKPTPPIELEP